MRKLILSALVLLGLWGCSTSLWVKPPQEEYFHAQLKFRAMLPQSWMRFKPDRGLVMTKDGVTLNIIVVEKLKFKDNLQFTKRQFSSDMTPLELAEVELDNLKSNTNIAKFEVQENTPAEISKQQAFFLKYTFETIAGLKIRCQHYGFIYNGHVYRVLYQGADQYYYPKTVKDFEEFVRSIQLTETKE